MDEFANERIIQTLRSAIASNNEEIDALKDIIARCEALKETLNTALQELA